ncbi:hypothetical protein EG329_004520 [Mollisiaceae sp. DMI_Dod_QoI]|nr:hypothetical protein EG329_004520 [Helotiales sp. DMI_Dod_QoI]
MSLNSSVMEPWTAFMTTVEKLESRATPLRGLAIATEVFKVLLGVQISLDVACKPLHIARWIPAPDSLWPKIQPGHCPLISRQNTFACIAFFATGSIDLPPQNLKQVMAMSITNCIYAAAPLVWKPRTSMKSDA